MLENMKNFQASEEASYLYRDPIPYLACSLIRNYYTYPTEALLKELSQLCYVTPCRTTNYIHKTA